MSRRHFVTPSHRWQACFAQTLTIFTDFSAGLALFRAVKLMIFLVIVHIFFYFIRIFQDSFVILQSKL